MKKKLTRSQHSGLSMYKNHGCEIHASLVKKENSYNLDMAISFKNFIYYYPAQCYIINLRIYNWGGGGCQVSDIQIH